jgi:transmembrane sensor
MTKEEVENIILKYLHGEASEEEKQELSVWLRSNCDIDSWWESQIKEAPDTMSEEQKERVLNQIKQEINNKTDIDNSTGETEQEQTQLKKHSVVMSMLRWAAVIALPIASALITYNLTKSEPYVYTVRADRGSQTTVMLPDSTHVTLSSASTLTYDNDFGRKSRDVKLNGEAFFDVKHDASKPFHVNSDALNISVLGTAFSINNFSNEATASVVLMRGCVHLLADGLDKIMQPDDKVDYDKNAKTFTVKKVNSKDYVEWTKGALRFDNETFANIMKDLSRIHGVNIHYDHKAWIGQRFSGTLPDSNFTEAMYILSATAPFQYTVKGNDVFIVREH